MHRRHFLYLLITMLVLPPLAITGKLAGWEANAQSLDGAKSAADPSLPSNVRGTRHNLSTSAPSRSSTVGTGTSASPTTELQVISGGGSGTTEVCVFCHTPHGATNPGRPLWNRSDGIETYTPYSSSSLQATDIDVTAAALGAPSKMCLSCHDGTIALGNVANAPGSGFGSAIGLANTAAGGGVNTTGAATMPYGRGQANANHGFTRRLGTDLRNDHPIAFTYDDTLAEADGELRRLPLLTPPTLNGRPLIGERVANSAKPYFPLVGGKVQCTTCHDPHKQTQKFLNTNRLVREAPDNAQSYNNNWTFNESNDQICVACHTRLGKAWAVSAHSLSTAANEIYRSGDAAMRDFPTGTQVWKAGCLNCHDTHTVAGSRRLLREGSTSGLGSVTPGLLGYSASFRLGSPAGADYDSTSALENTCYQCHSSTSVITPTLLSATEGVPDIQTEFARLYHMPITNSEQGDGGNTTEVHDVIDKDKMESQTKLGLYAPQNRHVECTDCHNPHRVVKADTFLGANLSGGSITRRTHVPARGTVGEYGNIAGGALRGAWGVEPSFTAGGQTTVSTSSIWMGNEEPTFTVKKGDPGGATTLPVGAAGTNAATYLTREYQLCFKCHSSYANGPLKTDFPQLKGNPGLGGTPTTGVSGGTPNNAVTRYTDVAKEFAVRATDPPSSGGDQGEMTSGGFDPSTPSHPASLGPLGSGLGAANSTNETNNHRSWHPVVLPTGRTGADRTNGATFTNIRAPFNAAAKVGYQTMHCSDCHGARGSWLQGTGPDLTKVQGPHGSGDPFLLKGIWSTAASISNISDVTGGVANYICGNCHNPTSGGSGFQTPGDGKGGTDGSHGGDYKASRTCNRCHVMVPHGWKNKAFLVNLRCVGPENGETSGFTNGCKDMTGSNPYTAQPYYVQARLRMASWGRSAQWTAANCTGTDQMNSFCN